MYTHCVDVGSATGCHTDVAPAARRCSSCVCYSIPPPSSWKHRPSTVAASMAPGVATRILAGRRLVKLAMCPTPSTLSPPFAGSSKKKRRFRQKKLLVIAKTTAPKSQHPITPVCWFQQKKNVNSSKKKTTGHSQNHRRSQQKPSPQHPINPIYYFQQNKSSIPAKRNIDSSKNHRWC